MELKEWIIKEKGYGERSARDVLSRLRRAQTLCGKENFSMEELEKNKEFSKLSVSVKSQIRSAVRIRDAFKGRKK